MEFGAVEGGDEIFLMSSGIGRLQPVLSGVDTMRATILLDQRKERGYERSLVNRGGLEPPTR